MTPKKDRQKIAILGWGSLLWEPGGDFASSIEAWKDDGPTIPIEFSRVSKKREGALTLVIDSRHGTPTQVAWCLTKRGELADAVADLRCREGTTLANIGHFHLSEEPEGRTEVENAILAWAAEKKLDAVVWTALPSNFEKKAGAPFSIDNAVAHIKALSVEGKVKAAEYVWMAPAFVRTPLRAALQKEPWFTEAPSREKIENV